MADRVPFQPNNASSTVGATVKVTANTQAASLVDCRSIPASSIQVTNASAVLVFVRMSAEATPTAAATDLPIMNGDTKVFGNPVSLGLLGVAVLSSSGSADVYFTPGNGGI